MRTLGMGRQPITNTLSIAANPYRLPLLDPLPFGSLPATMNAASGSQPARGVIVAPLIEFHPDRIVVGSCTLFLRDGKRCTYAVGTPLEVAYTEVDGRRDVDSITPIRPVH